MTENRPYILGDKVILTENGCSRGFSHVSGPANVLMTEIIPIKAAKALAEQFNDIYEAGIAEGERRAAARKEVR